MLGHCPIDPLNETGEKFFQIWSHIAVNLSNDLIEYTIRRMQSDRLRFLFQLRNEFSQQDNISPICQMSVHIEDDLKGIKEHIRRFCLTTRNVYRHLRSDSRIYPKMSIDLDQGIMIKVCRFIFKTKVLIKILAKEQHLSEQLNKDKIKQFDVNDPYRNITKAFIVLQSNFEILFGDILDRDFFQNAKSAVQTLPIILDTSKTIRLIFCALYKINEPERQAEAEAIRQRRLALCARGYGSKKPELMTMNIPIKNQENSKLKNMNEILKTNQSQMTYTSAPTPSKTPSSPPKILSEKKSTNQSKTKTQENSKKVQSSKSQLRTPKTIVSKTSKDRLSPSTSKKSSTTQQEKTKSPNVKSEPQKKAKSKNKNASTTDPSSSNKYNASTISINNNNTIKKFKDTSQSSSKEKIGWTTWLYNTTLNLATIFPSDQTNINVEPSKSLLTTWASLDRISKI